MEKVNRNHNMHVEWGRARTRTAAAERLMVVCFQCMAETILKRTTQHTWSPASAPLGIRRIVDMRLLEESGLEI